jgi:hypothetical protein
VLRDALPGRRRNATTAVEPDRVRNLYLDLMQRCIINTIYRDPSQAPWAERSFDPADRDRGLDWPLQAHSMIGVQRMQNLRMCSERVIRDNIRGDFVETGVWRGGACIFMRAVLAAYGVYDRTVWVADSFEGLPPPDSGAYPLDRGHHLHEYRQLAVGIEEVRENFARYGLLDGQVRFLKGWFKDTLPGAPIVRLAILRLDGDMYQSTMEAFASLYDKLSVGGYVIVDDYSLDRCRAAVTDFRAARAIVDAIQPIDGSGVYWRKTVA